MALLSAVTVVGGVVRDCAALGQDSQRVFSRTLGLQWDSFHKMTVPCFATFGGH